MNLERFYDYLFTIIETLQDFYYWFVTPIDFNIFGVYSPFELVLGGGLMIILTYGLIKWVLDIVL